MPWNRWRGCWQKFCWNSFFFQSHTKGMMRKFMIYGVLGWCMEILWTGFCAFLSGDAALTAKTYLWMFPIYGMTVFMEPLFLSFRRYCPLWQRMGFYTFCIFAVEFLMGWFLQTMTGVCPWDYGDRMFSVMGFIRLDYAPLWAGLGCVLEEVSVFLAEKEVKG